MTRRPLLLLLVGVLVLLASFLAAAAKPDPKARVVADPTCRKVLSTELGFLLGPLNKTLADKDAGTSTYVNLTVEATAAQATRALEALQAALDMVEDGGDAESDKDRDDDENDDDHGERHYDKVAPAPAASAVASALAGGCDNETIAWAVQWLLDPLEQALLVLGANDTGNVSVALGAEVGDARESLGTLFSTVSGAAPNCNSDHCPALELEGCSADSDCQLFRRCYRCCCYDRPP